MPVVAGQPAQVRWAAGGSGRVHWLVAQLAGGTALGTGGLPPGAYGLRLHAADGSSTTLHLLVQ